jgi:hypothetical protein
MADSTLDVTQPFDRPQKLLKIIDNGDGTYSIASVMFNGLVPNAYDYISLGYTGDNLTSVVYKTGGSGGTTVATLTLAYSGSTLTSVTKT